MDAVTVAAVVVAGIAVCALGYFFLAPSGIETPAYRVLRADGPFELRDYPAMVVAENHQAGSRRQAVQRGFLPLARYIFARRRNGPRIAMTAPVLQRPLAQGWAIAFIMPAALDPAVLPAPAGPSVRLRSIPSCQQASVRFSGVATDARLAEREQALRSWLADRGLPSGGVAAYAYYNDPITPGFLRRNEILIEIEGD
ncbi:MAG: heme-binding protein [Pseudomonadota bacterium]